MGQHGMTPYYKDKLEKGLKYQDFVCDVLMREHGIYVGQYSSREWQQEHGESASGIEIKHDMRMSETGNVYIEVAEKSNASNAKYVASGCMRDDNTWLYFIGDYSYAVMLSKRQLQEMVRRCESSEQYARKCGMRKVQTDTSIGWLIPVSYCRKFLALKEFKFDGMENDL